MTKDQHPRLAPQIVVRTDSPNKSARTAGIKLELIVLHSTESSNVPNSATDLEGVAGWFANPSAQVSAHVITDADGHSARCVPDLLKAWHVAEFNSAALGIEQIGHAADLDWSKRDAQLDETARWIARWNQRHGIPIRRGAVSGASVQAAGVVTHAQLGAAGGGHTDPGTHYPVDEVIRRAARFAKALRG